MTRTITQNRRIWKLVSTLAEAARVTREYAEVCMRDVCEEISGMRSSSQLTEEQAATLIRKLKALIITASGNRSKPKPDPEALATDDQLATLNKLFLDVGMDTDQRQMAFCRRVIKSFMPITRADAYKVHEALENMYVRQFDDAAIDKMLAVSIRNKESLTVWEKGFIDDIYRQIRANKFKRLSSMKVKKLKEIHDKLRNQND